MVSRYAPLALASVLLAGALGCRLYTRQEPPPPHGAGWVALCQGGFANIYSSYSDGEYRSIEHAAATTIRTMARVNEYETPRLLKGELVTGPQLARAPEREPAEAGISVTAQGSTEEKSQ
ncbi:MAG: hypothetical protein IPK13_03695 [Deltaproteobacteria bacterium]|nr:hypothetical protein [Deltaproteobacteria bacterium]